MGTIFLLDALRCRFFIYQGSIKAHCTLSLKIVEIVHKESVDTFVVFWVEQNSIVFCDQELSDGVYSPDYHITCLDSNNSEIITPLRVVQVETFYLS